MRSGIIAEKVAQKKPKAKKKKRQKEDERADFDDRRSDDEGVIEQDEDSWSRSGGSELDD